MDELIKLKRDTFMWKLDNNLLPQSNSGCFSLSNSVIRKRLNLSNYRIPNPRIGYTKRHNIYSATKLWNTEIPIQLKQSTSLKVFKKSYNVMYFSNQYTSYKNKKYMYNVNCYRFVEGRSTDKTLAGAVALCNPEVIRDF